MWIFRLALVTAQNRPVRPFVVTPLTVLLRVTKYPQVGEQLRLWTPLVASLSRYVSKQVVPCKGMEPPLATFLQEVTKSRVPLSLPVGSLSAKGTLPVGTFLKRSNKPLGTAPRLTVTWVARLTNIRKELPLAGIHDMITIAEIRPLGRNITNRSPKLVPVANALPTPLTYVGTTTSPRRGDHAIRLDGKLLPLPLKLLAWLAVMEDRLARTLG